MNFNDRWQSNQPTPAPAGYPPPASLKLGKKRGRVWLWTILAVLVLAAAVIFLVAVYVEVSSRDAALKNFLKSAQQETSGSIIENQLLSGLSGAITGDPTAANPTSTLVVGISGGSKDQNRRLAEKSGRPQLGNTAAGLVIVEFIDFQCPICLQEFPIIRAVSNAYAQDILFIVRNYPVIDQNSMMFAEAGLCAEEQGKFWPFHDRLYAQQGQIANLDDFKQIAVMSGLNWNKLQDCVNKEKYKSVILEDMSDALDLGVRGTPTFFVNGKKLEGAIDRATWDEIIRKYKELTK